eukprot:scaffold9207_cov84-Cyclotella_meneghiniana.AAC.6
MPRMVMKGVGVMWTVDCDLSECSGQPRGDDRFVQCVWKLIFESKSGNVPSIEVAKSGRDSFSTLATLISENKVTVIDNTVRGTTIAI